MTKGITKYKSVYNDLQVPKVEDTTTFLAFCEHRALPSTMRKHKDDKAFGRAYSVSHNTLVNWKKYPEYSSNIIKIAKVILADDIPTIMYICKEDAIKGDRHARKDLLDWLGMLQQETVAPNIVFQWSTNTDVKPKHVDAVDVDTTT